MWSRSWFIDGVAIVPAPRAGPRGPEDTVDVVLTKHCSVPQPPGGEHAKSYVAAGTVLRLCQSEAQALIKVGAAALAPQGALLSTPPPPRAAPPVPLDPMGQGPL